MISARDLASTETRDQNQFAVNELILPEIHDLEDVDQLVELFDNLIQGGVVAAGDDGHARGGGLLGGGDVERVDVVAAAAEKPGNAREHAEFVLHQHGYCMTHNVARVLCSGSGTVARASPIPTGAAGGLQAGTVPQAALANKDDSNCRQQRGPAFHGAHSSPGVVVGQQPIV